MVESAENTIQWYINEIIFTVKLCTLTISQLLARRCARTVISIIVIDLLTANPLDWVIDAYARRWITTYIFAHQLNVLSKTCNLILETVQGTNDTSDGSGLICEGIPEDEEWVQQFPVIWNVVFHMIFCFVFFVLNVVVLQLCLHYGCLSDLLGGLTSRSPLSLPTFTLLLLVNLEEICDEKEKSVPECRFQHGMYNRGLMIRKERWNWQSKYTRGLETNSDRHW